MNITDVDDKTIKKSREAGIPLREFTEKYTEAFFEDIDMLRIKHATLYPKATEHIDEIVELIKILIKKWLAYKGEDGSVYFDISKFKNYGRLANIKAKEMKSRIKQDEYEKEEARDFALWKAWSAEDGDVFWNANFDGIVIKGRPGWHIECSAMCTKYLGDTFDIHGGGVDLIFPHHENEIAQSEGAGNKFVRYWIHCEHLNVEGRKMSKSLGNYYTLRDLIKKGYDPVAIRYLLISSHYRSQLNFTFKELESARKTVESINFLVSKIKDLINKADAPNNEEISLLVDETKERFEEYMDDDLNVPEALASVFDMIKIVNQEIDKNRADKASLKKTYAFLMSINKIFDIITEEEKTLTAEEKQLIQQREEARKKKNFRQADVIRDQLKKKGVLLEDTPHGIRWRRIR
jgi:cysteinyl-tRNA synthetase